MIKPWKIMRTEVGQGLAIEAQTVAAFTLLAVCSP
jgi:hypothetical protein